MDGPRALLMDLANFLDSVEATIMNKTADLSDVLQITNLKHSLNTMDSMLKQCETSVSNQDLKEIKDRINMARETLEMLESSSSLRKTDQVYGDLYLVEKNGTDREDYRSYGKHLGISNEEFDQMIEDWAADLDTSQKVERRRKVDKIESFQDQIKGEMAQLAETMKSKAMRYRDIILKDNKALLKFTGEHERQLDTVTSVAKESSKLAKSASISFMQLIFMALTMIGLTFFIFFLFLVT